MEGHNSPFEILLPQLVYQHLVSHKIKVGDNIPHDIVTVLHVCDSLYYNYQEQGYLLTQQSEYWGKREKIFWKSNSWHATSKCKEKLNQQCGLTRWTVGGYRSRLVMEEIGVYCGEISIFMLKQSRGQILFFVTDPKPNID